MELIFEKQGDRWSAKKANGEALTLVGKAGDINGLMKSLWPDAKIGFKASDFGPAVAAECIRQGYGNVLWMK